jgi:alcohol dehydrogenase (nicotinoprotein)
MITTRAAVLDEGSSDFEIRGLSVDDPGFGEVRVKMVAAGLCHSDLHSVDGILLPRRPIVMGHEGSGIVESVGPGVTHIQPGDHIVCSFVPSCGRCRYCAQGMSGMCDLSAHAIIGDQADGTFRFHGSDGRDYGGLCMLGTFSEYMTVSEHSVVKVDPWIPLEVAVLVGCGVPTGWGSAVVAGDVKAGDTAVIYGAGGIGMNAVQGAAYAGAKFVAVVEPVQFKREVALKFGATHVFETAEEAAGKVRELTWGQGADQAIITVDLAEEGVITAAFNIVGKRGVVVVTSLAGADDVNIHLPSAWLTKYEITVRGAQFGSMNPQWDIVKLLRMYNDGKLLLDELCTRTYTLDEVNEGYADLRAGEIIRGVILFDS